MRGRLDEIPVRFGRLDADEGGIESKARVDQLKREISNNRYDVPAPAVADAILRKIRLLKQARGDAAISEAGRSLPGSENPQAR